MVVDAIFEKELDLFLAEQKSKATPRRLEMLERDLTGTKKLMKELMWPIFQRFDGFELEHEIKGANGVSIFIDVFYAPLRLAFECEGFSAHAETISRRRFDFEKYRVRLMLIQGIHYLPFNWDELDDKSHANLIYLKKLIGILSSKVNHQLSVYEREVIRAYGPSQLVFNAEQVCLLLSRKKRFCQRVVKSLVEKGLVRPSRPGLLRNHHFLVESVQLVAV